VLFVCPSVCPSVCVRLRGSGVASMKQMSSCSYQNAKGHILGDFFPEKRSLVALPLNKSGVQVLLLKEVGEKNGDREKKKKESTEREL